MSTHPLYDSKLLLQQVAEGSQHAFRRVYDYYYNRIYNYALKIVQSEAVAEDILQDVFVKVWLNRGELPAIQKFEPWLYTIARNHTFNALKREAHRQPLSDRLAEKTKNEEFSAEEKLHLKQYQARLYAVVEKLPSQQRSVYILSKEEGLKREEIAAKMNISPETVKYHLAEAMKFIRAHITDEHLLLFLLFMGTLVAGK